MEVMRFFSTHNFFFLVLLKNTQYVFTVRTLLRNSNNGNVLGE